MIKLTQGQFNALIEYINAAVEDGKPTADLYDSVRKLQAREDLEKELLANDDDNFLSFLR